MKKHLITALKAMLIGASMLIPGVSGGTMAIILNVYDKLLSSVSHFFSAPKKNAAFLGVFVAGGLLGVFLFSNIILTVTNTFPFPMMFFFMGAILGGLPALLDHAKTESGFQLRQILYVLIGAAVVLAMSFEPTGLFTAGTGFQAVLVLFIAGILCAAALILPGISISYMLLIFGLYEPAMTAIHTLDFGFLLPIGFGLLAGILLMVKLLEKAMVKAPQVTYPVIIGFLLGSLPQVFPGIPTGFNWIICPVMLAAGFAGIMLLSRLTVDADN